MVLPDAEPLHEEHVRPADWNGQAIPTHQTTSPKAILLAKSEIRTIQVWQTVENLVFQHTDGRENDFAISIAFGEAVILER